jgi:ubiquinone/menaquinone biosynthesis C-methylase UbiE
LNEANPYSIGQSGDVLKFMRFRTAERCCDFMREFVEPDSQILDCGCGPGSITLGLARWAPQGKVIGIDAAEAPLVQARALARDLAVTNVEFNQADVFNLPYEDARFDVVFSSALFCHLSGLDSVLAEIKRVLKPGGIVAVRDVIFDCVIMHPQDNLLEEFYKILVLGIEHYGGNASIGRELGAWLHTAGFANVMLTVGTNQPKDASERAEFYSAVVRLLSDELSELAVANGWTTTDRIAQIVGRFEALASEPGSISVATYGQAVGRKP